MQRNVAGQTWLAFAFNRLTGAPITGDASNITGQLSKDGGTLTALATPNPTEVALGYYRFALTQAETNAAQLDLIVNSSTSNVAAIAVEASRQTVPERFSGLEIDAEGTVRVPAADRVIVAIPRLVAQSTLGGVPLLRRADVDQPGELTFYRGTQWSLILEDVGVLPEGNEVYMTLKSGDLVTALDTAAILQIKVDLTDDEITLVRINGAAPDSGLLDKFEMTYESYDDEGTTKWRVVIVIEDDITALMVPGSYAYDLKSVGDPSTLLDIGTIEVAADTTRAH